MAILIFVYIKFEKNIYKNPQNKFVQKIDVGQVGDKQGYAC